MTSDTTQHRLKHTYNTYYYKSLKQNTTPPLKKRWLIKMSQNKTAWSSILSNDGTLLYTNSLDALHHLGSCSNCLKTYNINQHLDIECAGKTRSWFFPFCQTMERCWVRWRNRKWKVCREVWRPRTVSEIRLRPPTTTRCLRPVYCELLLMSYVVLKNRVTARLTLTQICLPVLFCGVSYGYLHYQWFLLRNSVSGFWCHRLERPASPRRICAVTRGFLDNDSSPFCFPVPTKTLSYDSCVTITIHHYCWTPVVLAMINII